MIAVGFFVRQGERPKEWQAQLHCAALDVMVEQSRMFCEITEKLNDPLMRHILSACLFDNTPEGIDNAISRYPDERFYGWHENGKLVAVCGFRVLNNKVEICHIAVAENSRRNGIGKAIIPAQYIIQYVKVDYMIPVSCQAETSGS